MHHVLIQEALVWQRNNELGEPNVNLHAQAMRIYNQFWLPQYKKERQNKT